MQVLFYIYISLNIIKKFHNVTTYILCFFSWYPPSQNMKYAFSLTSSKDILNEFKNEFYRGIFIRINAVSNGRKKLKDEIQLFQNKCCTLTMTNDDL